MALIKLHQIDFNQTGSYTGSLYGTASYALTASYASNVPDTASFALSSSYAVSSSNSLTSSYTEGLGGSNFTQNFSNSTTWTVNHNLGNKYVIIQVYDLNYDEILPQNIDLLDNNTAVITFPTPESGTVVVTLGGALQYVYNIDTSSLTPLSVFNQFTSSYNTSSFTGSFTGDGSSLYNIPSSGITGLNLSQIASGSVTASISPSGGFRINTNTQITGSLTIQPTSSATQTVSIIQAGSGSIALVPSGSGAIMASIPDGTAAGGNARGANAVDFQTVRSVNTSVASGTYSGVLSGRSNSAENTYSVTAGGFSNVNSTLGGTIAGGRSNTVNAAADATIGGGNSNTASSNYSVISGGQSNTASTNTHATVVGGYQNTASGTGTVVGGFTNVASGIYSIALGSNNTSNGVISATIGAQNIASGTTSIALNANSNSYLYSQQSNASGQFAANGDAQQSLLTARRESTLTTAQTSSLSLDGTGTTNLIIPKGTNRTWNTTVKWVATVTGSSGTTTGVSVGNSIYGVSEFGFKVSASIASITPLIRDSIVADTTIMETATLTYATGSSNSLAMTFTAPTFAGGGSLGMRVVAKVSLVELAW